MLTENEIFSSISAELSLDSWGKELLGTTTVLEKLDVFKAFESIPRTELRAAQTIYSKLGKRLTYVGASNTWYLWDGHIHRPCEDDAIAVKFIHAYYEATDTAVGYVKSYYEALAAGIKVSGIADADAKAKAMLAQYDNGEIKKHKSFRDNLAENKGQRAVLAQMKVMFGVSADYFEIDERNWYVTDNCVIDVRETERQQRVVTATHDPSRAVWRAFQGPYDPTAYSPELSKFLRNSFADETQADFFGRVVGTAMIGAPAKMKTIVDVFGATDGGKSMINLIINTLAPDFYCEATENAIVKGGKDHDRYRDGMRLARIISFLEVKGKLDKTFILKYTGGDVVETDRKYRNSLKWRAQGVILMMSNEGMNIGSQEAAVADRIERVNFPHTFVPQDSMGSVPEHLIKDMTLGDRIIANPAAFLNWMLNGYLSHLRDNLDGKPKPSESMAFLKAELQDNDNTAAIFWEKAEGSKYVLLPTAPASQKVRFTVVYANYRQWCAENHMKVMEEADVKAWFGKEGLSGRVSSQLRLTDYVESGSKYARVA